MFDYFRITALGEALLSVQLCFPSSDGDLIAELLDSLDVVRFLSSFRRPLRFRVLVAAVSKDQEYFVRVRSENNASMCINCLCSNSLRLLHFVDLSPLPIQGCSWMTI